MCWMWDDLKVMNAFFAGCLLFLWIYFFPFFDKIFACQDSLASQHALLKVVFKSLKKNKWILEPNFKDWKGESYLHASVSVCTACVCHDVIWEIWEMSDRPLSPSCWCDFDVNQHAADDKGKLRRSGTNWLITASPCYSSAKEWSGGVCLKLNKSGLPKVSAEQAGAFSSAANWALMIQRCFCVSSIKGELTPPHNRRHFKGQ